MKKIDGRKNNRGHKGVSGRKPKSEEIALIERLTPMDDLALGVLKKKVEEGDMKALTLFMNYRFGKAKESKEITIAQEIPMFGLDYDELATDIESEEI